MNDEKLQIEIWSDIVCPWCYVGKRRFEAALARSSTATRSRSCGAASSSTRRRRAARDGDRATHLAAKYGMTLERRGDAAPDDRAAAGDGLDFRFDRARGGNTFDAHRLIHLAAAHGRQDAVKERLMRAYFTEGEPIADPATLRAWPSRPAWPPTRSRDVLAATASPTTSARTSARRRARHHRACRSSCRPPLGVSGAQPPEVLLASPRQAWEAAAAGRRRRRRACGPDGC